LKLTQNNKCTWRCFMSSAPSAADYWCLNPHFFDSKTYMFKILLAMN